MDVIHTGAHQMSNMPTPAAAITQAQSASGTTRSSSSSSSSTAATATTSTGGGHTSNSQQASAGNAAAGAGHAAAARQHMDRVQQHIRQQHATNQRQQAREFTDCASHYLSQASRHLQLLQEIPSVHATVQDRVLELNIPPVPAAATAAASSSTAAPAGTENSGSADVDGPTPASSSHSTSSSSSSSSNTTTATSSSSSTTSTTSGAASGSSATPGAARSGQATSASSSATATPATTRSAELVAILRQQMVPYLRCLAPAVQQCVEILENPNVQDSDAQYILDSVFESIHSLSHSCASLADLDVDVGQPAPRPVSSYMTRSVEMTTVMASVGPDGDAITTNPVVLGGERRSAQGRGQPRAAQRTSSSSSSPSSSAAPTASAASSASHPATTSAPRQQSAAPTNSSSAGTMPAGGQPGQAPQPGQFPAFFMMPPAGMPGMMPGVQMSSFSTGPGGPGVPAAHANAHQLPAGFAHMAMHSAAMAANAAANSAATAAATAATAAATAATAAATANAASGVHPPGPASSSGTAATSQSTHAMPASASASNSSSSTSSGSTPSRASTAAPSAANEPAAPNPGPGLFPGMPMPIPMMMPPGAHGAQPMGRSPVRHQTRAQVVPPVAGSSMINMCPHPRHRSLEPESSPAAQPHAHVHIIPGMPMGMMPPAAGAAFGGVPMPGQHNAGVQGQGGSAPGQPNVHHVFFRRGPDGNMEPVPGAAGVGGAAPAGTAAGVAGAAAMMQHIAAAAAAHASATAPGGQNPAQRQQAGSRSATNPSTGQPQPSSSSSSSNQHGRVQVPAALIHGLYQEASNPREGVSVHDVVVQLSQADSPMEDEEEEGPVGVLLSAACRHLSMPDFLAITQGETAPLVRIAPQLRQALYNDILHGEPWTEHSLQEIANHVSSDCEDMVREALVGVPTRTAVRLCETTLQEIRQVAVVFFRGLHETDPSAADYYERVWSPVHREMGNSLSVMAHGLTQGTASLHVVLERLLQYMLDLQVEHQSMAMMAPMFYATVMRGIVERLLASSALTGAERDARLIRVSPTTSATPTSAPPAAATAAANAAIARASSSTQQPARSRASTSSSSTSRTGAAAQRTPLSGSSSSVSTGSSATAPTPIAESSGQPEQDMASESAPAASATQRREQGQEESMEEDWQEMVPASWIPVIAEDIVRQRLTSSRRPHSDAYSSTMASSKRRKTSTTGSTASSDTAGSADSDHPSSEKLPMALRKAIRDAGVEPITTVNDVLASATSDTGLQQAYEPALQNLVAERLQTDADYDPQRFPNLRSLFG
ncbi:mucin-19-like [Sycon ciliatum]|uniref:mucin-19-like n=1 Tax=Sycon ciliatum TaxID=27933 RepID=UPI0031F66473